MSYSDSDNDGKVDVLRNNTDIDGDGDNSHEIREVGDFYPFGMEIQYGSNHPNSLITGRDHQYGYLNQEGQNELGLNWLTFRYRNYMPEIGRFFGVDPVSAEYMSISTYQFAHNSPVWKIEIEGLEGATTTGNGNDDIITHEPVKAFVPGTGTAIGGSATRELAKKAAGKVVQKTVAKTVAEKVLSGLVSVAKGAGTLITALLSVQQAHAPGIPLFEYDSDGNPIIPDYNIDKRIKVDDRQLEIEEDDDSPVKRVFERNEKHGSKKRGRANKEPQNPQDVLNNSHELPGNTTRRIGVDFDNEEFNVFDEHSPGKFHGHVREWKELSPQMQSLLRKLGLANKKGKIIKPRNGENNQNQ